MTCTQLLLTVLPSSPRISTLDPAVMDCSVFSGLYTELVEICTSKASSPFLFMRKKTFPLENMISQFGLSFVAWFRSSSSEVAMRDCAAAIVSDKSFALLAASCACFSCLAVKVTPTIAATTDITALIALIHAGTSMLTSSSVGCGDISTVGDERGEGVGFTAPSSRGGDCVD